MAKMEIAFFKNFWRSIFSGAGIGGLFIFINRISPNFTLGLPNLPLALSNFFKGFFIIFTAPILEESVFRKVLVEKLVNEYGHPYWLANIEQAIAFTLYHILVYGIALGQLATLTQAFGLFTAVLGLFLGAFIFGLTAGLIVKQFNNLLPSIIAHATINGFLFAAVFVVVGGIK